MGIQKPINVVFIAFVTVSILLIPGQSGWAAQLKITRVYLDIGESNDMHIYGYNLKNGKKLQVSICDMPATIKHWYDTEIVAEIPFVVTASYVGQDCKLKVKTGNIAHKKDTYDLTIGHDIRSIVSQIHTNMVPKGGIIMWSGSIEDIPSGWALCDGLNGTPDLSNRFILGVADQEEPGSIGGSSAHSHNIPRVPVTYGYGNTFDGKDREVGFEITAGSYRFVMNRYYYNPKWWKWAPTESGAGYLSGSPYYKLHTDENTADSRATLPPYYKLAFIIKQQ